MDGGGVRQAKHTRRGWVCLFIWGMMERSDFEIPTQLPDELGRKLAGRIIADVIKRARAGDADAVEFVARHVVPAWRADIARMLADGPGALEREISAGPTPAQALNDLERNEQALRAAQKRIRARRAALHTQLDAIIAKRGA